MQTVNHTLNFVDPTNGTHTQNVESYWNRVKTKFKRMKGVHESMLGSYMDESCGGNDMVLVHPPHLPVYAGTSEPRAMETAYCDPDGVET